MATSCDRYVVVKYALTSSSCVTVRRMNILYYGLQRISYPAPAPAEIRPNFHIRPSGPGRIWPPDMRSDLTIFRCICLGRKSLFYKFGNLHLSISSRACAILMIAMVLLFTLVCFILLVARCTYTKSNIR